MVSEGLGAQVQVLHAVPVWAPAQQALGGGRDDVLGNVSEVVHEPPSGRKSSEVAC